MFGHALFWYFVLLATGGIGVTYCVSHLLNRV